MKVLRSRSFALRGARRRDELATWLKKLQLGLKPPRENI